MRKVFAGLATVLLVAVVVQFFLAASGAFDTAPNDESFQPHRALGYGIFLFAILLTVIAALARMPGRIIGMTGLIAGLALTQGLIAALAHAFDGPGDTSTTTGHLIFGLHAINGGAIFGLAETVARRARSLSGPKAPAPPRPTRAEQGQPPTQPTAAQPAS